MGLRSREARATRRWIGILRTAFDLTGLLLVSEAASAAGNAHVVDDAEVETEGVCHLETWATLFPRGGLVTAAPGCTFRGLSGVEFGGSVVQGWSDGDTWTTVAPAVKVALRPVGRGPGLPPRWISAAAASRPPRSSSP